MPDTTEINVVCSSCDNFCPVRAKVVNGQVVKVAARNDPFLRDIICVKGAYAPKSFAHPERILHPLKRTGARGANEWQRVSWNDALDDIADRLQSIVRKYGPESLAVATSHWNTTVDNGLCRRFMNLLGSPNFISGVAYCMGNTAAVNRMVYGWYPQPDILNSKCIVLFGHNPRRHSWTAEYKMIRVAQAMGAKLIMLDPRKSENAELADLWLPLRAGTDAAMCLGWLNVIVNEALYDKAFVRNWTIGFEQLAERVRDYPVDRVAAITGVAPELIVDAARLYATTRPGVIPWSPITDQQVSSTSAIRMHAILRALTGNLDVKGGERFLPFNPSIVHDTDIEMHDALAPAQKAKQLGADEFPVFTYRGLEPFREPTRRVFGRDWANLVTGQYMANPTSVFRAMATGRPYPVKALFSLGNNTLMGFANMQQIHRGLMHQDLIVVHEHMMTPTAQLADYVLPGDAWLERPSMMVGVSPAAMTAPGECRSVFEFWTGLARRMGLGEHFPWATLEELYDYRLSPGGTTWAQALASGSLPVRDHVERFYEQTGFATPSGKVELYSRVLEGFGFDPLPYYREARQPDTTFPLSLFVGVRDDQYFQSGHRHVPELRARTPEPTAFLNPATATGWGIGSGDWLTVRTAHGAVTMRAELRLQMPENLVRVPHGWWKPESGRGGDQLSGAWAFSDAQLTGDDDMELMDREQGIPHLKGTPCRIDKLTDSQVAELEERFGPSATLPRGPKPEIIRSDRKGPEDFMYDPEVGDGVEFNAKELSAYGKGSLR
ncbi:MAG: molybdopterin-dependent oxidoreductase [Pseudomonadales bacterium]|nr:molybdopterin-dependent oxidoreductase [Pseudomonadales bacterium]MCP5185301.1 molybdopterin-dependent oxidoreductase [Pseudomonadales bacterium]